MSAPQWFPAGGRGGRGATNGHSNLGSDVAELRPDSQEEISLLAQWARVEVADLALDDMHVGVGDLGHGREEEQNDEEGDEDGDAEVDPLHVAQTLGRVDRVGEEDARGQQRSH